jgi:hypothetical protein
MDTNEGRARYEYQLARSFNALLAAAREAEARGDESAYEDLAGMAQHLTGLQEASLSGKRRRIEGQR